MKIRVVTTCNAKGWDETGRKMVETFGKFWPEDVRLILYAEGFETWPTSSNVEIRQLPQWFEEWKASHKDNSDAHGANRRRNRPGRVYDYRRDCVRFSHKVAALVDAACEPCDMLIWMDADTLTHAPVTVDWLESLFPKKAYMAWLDRKGNYPECGFMMFRPSHPKHSAFMGLLRETYESNRVLKFEQTHDSFVIEKLVEQCVTDKWFEAPFSLSGKARIHHHVFPHSRLGERLDHAKGAFKEVGRTPKERLHAPRSEDYWQ